MSNRFRARAWKGGELRLLDGQWGQYTSPIDSDLRHGLQRLRARARDLAQNNAHVRHFITLLHANVIGPRGITLQSQAVTRAGRPDKRARQAIESAWQAWTKPGQCDVTGKLSFRDVCRLALSSMVRDGEALIRIVPGYGPGDFALQVLDPEILDIRKNEDGPRSIVRMGVEMDSWRRPIAYWLKPEPGVHWQSYSAGDSRPIDASEILHIYLPEWTWQSRGIPWIATAITRLHHLGEYEEAELIAARAGAEKPGHYKKTEDAIGAPGVNEDGEQNLESDLIQEIRAGEYGILPPGWDFQLDDPTHPTTAFPDFVKAALRSIASGLGVDYNSLANDLEGVNYTSLRHGQLNARAIWMMLQEWFIEAALEPIWSAWLDTSLQLGRIQLANGSPLEPQRLNQYAPAKWQARRWAWVDPLKEVQAHKEAVALRTRSISSIIREQGDDPEDVWAEIARDTEMLEQYGIPPPAEMSAPMTETEQDEPEPEEEEESEDDLTT